MSYNLRWNAAARNTLATIWVGSANRRAVTAAQARIDRLLSTDPLRNSTPLSEGLYVIEVHPLRAVFEVDDTDKTVKVVSVGEIA
jgi:plasmid stabilization system protein ParE